MPGVYSLSAKVEITYFPKTTLQKIGKKETKLFKLRLLLYVKN